MTKRILSFVLAMMLVLGCTAASAEEHSTNKHSMYETTATATLTYEVSRVWEWTVPAEVEIEFTAEDEYKDFGYVTIQNIILGNYKVNDVAKDILIKITYKDRTDLNLYPIKEYKNGDTNTTLTLDEYAAAEADVKAACEPVYDLTATPLSTIAKDDTTNHQDWRLYFEKMHAEKDDKGAYATYNVGTSNFITTEGKDYYDLDKLNDKTLLAVRTGTKDYYLQLETLVDADTKKLIDGADLKKVDSNNNYAMDGQPLTETTIIESNPLVYSNRGVPSKLGYHQGSVTYECSCEDIDVFNPVP